MDFSEGRHRHAPFCDCFELKNCLALPTAKFIVDHKSRIYKNSGNAQVIALLDQDLNRVLDVGCGAGDNALLMRAKFPQCEIHGVTHSASEAAIAQHYLASCWVFDIEGDLPSSLTAIKFDAVVFSHVLEHLRDPASTLAVFTRLLRPGGCVIIAVPNVVFWSMRWRVLRGIFEYTRDGVLDETHLRFLTFLTADRFLLAKSPGLKLLSKSVSGSVPLWWFRRHLLPIRWSGALDELGCRYWPNLFGEQVLLKAALNPARES